MNQLAATWRKLIAAAVTAAGLAVLWAAACIWLSSLAAALLPDRGRATEQLQVAIDGTPVISVESRLGYDTVSLSRRTLEGKTWPNDYEFWLRGAYLDGERRAPGILAFPIQWSSYGARILGGTDGKRPPTAWYVIRRPEDDAHVYLAGFDAMSKLPIGFIGTQGFRPSTPPITDQFGLAQGNLGSLGDSVVTSQYLTNNGFVDNHWLSNQDRLASWLVFLADGQRLWKVDLRERTSQAVLDIPETLSASMLIAREALVLGRPTDGDTSRQQSADQGRTPADGQSGDGAEPAAPPASAFPTERPDMTYVIAARLADRIVLYDAPTDRKWEFKLPADLPGGRVVAYWPSPDRLLLHYTSGYWSGGTVNFLLWIAPDGTTERQERVELQAYVPPPESREFWQFCAAVPVPVAWIGRVFGERPLSRMQYHFAHTYGGALQQVVNVTWPMALVVLLISVAAAWWAVRLQRRYYRPHTGIWAAFVLLFGPAGLAAYWLAERRPKLEPCGACGRLVPRDRDACAACDAVFPASPLVGTEIFA